MSTPDLATEPPAKPKSRALLGTAIRLAIAAALVAWVIHQTGWARLRDTLLGLDLGLWALGAALLCIQLLTTFIRWYGLLRAVGFDTPLGTVLRLGALGMLFNTVVPGQTGGDVVKAVAIAGQHPDRKALAVVSIAVDRVLGLLGLLFLGALAVTLQLGSGSEFAELAWGTYGALGAAIAGLCVVGSRRVRKYTSRVTGTAGRLVGERLSGLAKTLDAAVLAYRDQPRALLVACALSVFNHVVVMTAIATFGRAIAQGGLAAGAETSVPAEELQALLDLGALAWASVLPILLTISSLPLAPGGWGVGEAAFAEGFPLVGVPAAMGVAVSVVYRLSATILSLVGGIIAWMAKRD